MINYYELDEKNIYGLYSKGIFDVLGCDYFRVISSFLNFMVYSDNTFIGIVNLNTESTDDFIFLDIYILKEYQGLGYGKKITRYFMKIFENNTEVLIAQTKNNNISANKVLKKISESNYVQSTLIMIYNIRDLDKNAKDIAFHVFNYLLGSSGLNSKLYKNLRTDNSLCYGVRSLYLKYDELLIVSVSLDNKNVLKAESLIKKSIKEMIDGEFSEDDIFDAVKNLTFSLKLGLDSNTSILNNYAFNYFDCLPLVDERIIKLGKVTREEIIKCGKSLKLNTIYIQKAGDNNGRD